MDKIKKLHLQILRAEFEILQHETYEYIFYYFSKLFLVFIKWEEMMNQ